MDGGSENDPTAPGAESELAAYRAARYLVKRKLLPRIAQSARRHGVSDDDMLHAYAYPMWEFRFDEGLTMVIGANRAAIIHEVGVVDIDGEPMIVHAMKARDKFLW